MFIPKSSEETLKVIKKHFLRIKLQSVIWRLRLHTNSKYAVEWTTSTIKPAGTVSKI